MNNVVALKAARPAPTTSGPYALRVAPKHGVCSDDQVAVSPPRPDPTRKVPVEIGAETNASVRLDAVIREQSAYVARLAYRLLGSNEEVDDIVQDVFISLFRHLDRIRDTGALRAWLGTTTVRMARRRLRIRRVGFLLRINDRIDPSELRSAESSGEDRAEMIRIHRALDGVSSTARVAWVLRYVEQEAMEDVARLCDCSLSTAKRRVADAHGAVRKALGDDES